ncbi:DUF3237 domain-containing protein [Achromobacter aegrifaciens]
MNEIQTKFMFRLSLEVGAHHVMGPTPLGSRRVAPVSGGTFEGPELSGIVLPGGTDWITEDPAGAWFRIDVKLPLQTSEGDMLIMAYHGWRSGTKDTLAKLSRGEEVSPQDYYYRVACSFETASPKHARLNTTLAIGNGWRVPTGPGYDVYEVL